MIKNKLSSLFLLLTYLISFFLLARNTVLAKTLKWNTYSYSEYLISYPDKFIRRGLWGEVLGIIYQRVALLTIQTYSKK